MNAEVEIMGLMWNRGYLRTHPGMAHALYSGEFEGLEFRPIDREIQPGDTYLAERSPAVGIQLLTCDYVDPRGWVRPVEKAYPYDTGECVPIEFTNL